MQSTRERAVPFPVRDLKASLPNFNLPEDTDHAKIVKTAVKNLNLGLRATSMVEDAHWRDMFAMTGTLRTIAGSRTVEAAWKERCKVHEPTNFREIPGSSRVVRRGPKTSWVQGSLSFVTHGTPSQSCSAIICLVPDENSSAWKIWVLTTTLEQIEGLRNVDVPPPATLEPNSTIPPASSADFNVVVCGGGQAGLVISARLKAAGVPNCISIDKSDKIAGIWHYRYDCVKLHTSKDISQLPYGRFFPEEDPYYLGKEHLTRGYNRFVEKFNLDVWLSTCLDYATYDEEKKAWLLEITRNGEKQIISTKHVVLAVGPGGTVPKMPKFKNRELFKGQVMHSVEYRNPKGLAGKKAIIVGSANTAHDICEDMLHEGLESVTMIQRGHTPVVPAEYMRKNIEPLYGPHSDINQVDRIYQAMPTAIARLMVNRALNGFAAQQPERFDALERAGFKVERNIDMINILFERVGGHYMDVGASDLIIDGSIKLKSDSLISSYTETGVAFEDGSTLDADIIVHATGFDTNPRTQVAGLVGEEMEEKLENMWHCDKEGEILGLWKPMRQPGIWFAGGGLSQTRFFSRFLAIQLQADLAGKPLPQYFDTPSV